MSSSIDLPPSGQSQPAQPTPSGQSQSPAAVLRADAAVTQALARGTVLQGTVTGTPTTGQVTVQTPAGSVTLQTAVEIPTNSPVTLQPGTGEGQIRLSLPQSQTGTQTGTQAAGQTAATERPPAVVTTLTQGATVTATAVNPPGTGPQQPPQSQPSAGQQVPPQPSSTPATAAAQASSPSPSPTVQPASPAQPTATMQSAPPPKSTPAQAPSPPQTSAQSTPAQSAPAQSAPAPQQSPSAPPPSSGSASASGSSPPSGPSPSAGSPSTNAPPQQPAAPPAQSSGASQPSAAPPSPQPPPAQSTPVQSAPVQPDPVQPAPVQPTPAAPPPTPPPPIQNAPIQNAPAQPAPPTAGQPVTAPPTVQIPPSQAPLPQQPTMATVVTASPSLSRVLIAGQTVQGTFTAVPQAIPAPAAPPAPVTGSVTVQTTFGTINLRLPVPVPPGAGLTLTATGKGPLQTVQVSFTAPGSGNPPIPGQAAGPQTAPTPSPAGAGAGTGAGAKTTANATNPAQGPAGAAPSAQSNAATAGSIAAGSTVPVRLAAILPSGTPAPALAGLTNSAAPGLPVVIGSVIGETASGAALVRTSLGHFSVPVGSRPVPSGTTLVLEFTAQPTPPAAGSAVHAGQAVARQAGGGPFQALQEALALLQQADPGAAQQIAQSLIPTAGPQLGTALLFLLQAVRLGGAPRWLGGDTVRTLERARRGSVDRLSRDLGALRGKAMDSAGGEWRSYQLPVSVGGEIEALKLYLRDKENQSQDEGREKTKTGRRFIIEVNFTRLGPFQFDNIVEKKHIDLMIRTHAALPSDMRRDIQTLFADTVTALGLTGQVGYHVVKSFDLNAVDGPSGSDGVREDLSI